MEDRWLNPRIGWTVFEEIEKGNITENSFVVQPWYVHRGCPGGGWSCVDERYRDPVKFFDRTYFSEGLRSILENVVRRLAFGGPYNSVILLHTSFGGGKSHTLLAIYHVAKWPGKVAGSRRFREFLKSIGIDQLPDFKSAITVFDGSALDPVRLRRVYSKPNVWVFILEELARAAGAMRLVERVKRYNVVAPGHEEIGEFLASLEDAGVRPVVLIDELAMYIRNLEVLAEREEDARHELEGLRIFLHNLAVAVANARYAVLAIATPQQYEYESRQIVALLSDVKRVAMPTSIVGREDAAEVLKAALLKEVNADTAMAVAERYAKFYEEERKHLPVDVVTSEYRRKMVSSYPFHPFLVDVLYGEVAEVPGFQGTRDILRIVAWALYWRVRSGERYDVLLLGDIDVTRREILDELLTRNEYLRRLRNAVSYDVGVVEELDEAFARKGLPRVASLTYSAVLVRSTASKPSRIEEVVLGAATPIRGVSAHLVKQTLEDLLGKTAHLHRIMQGSETLYIVRIRANVYMLVNRLASEILERNREHVLERLESEMKKVLRSSAECEFIVWPRHPGMISDDTRVKLVLLYPEDPAVETGGDKVRALIERFTLYSQAGAGAAYRIHRNTMVYLVPDMRVYRQVIQSIARLMAIDRLLQQEYKQLYGLEREDEEELSRLRAKLLEELQSDIAALYTTLYYPVDVRPDGSPVFVEATVDPAKIRSMGLWKAVKEQLQKVGKLAEDVSAQYILDIIVKRYDALRRPLSLKDVISAFTEDPSSVLLINTERVVREKLAELVEQGRLVALMATGAICMRRPPLVSEEVAFVPCSSPEAKTYCYVAQGDEGLECRPKPPGNCAKPVWDVSSKTWKCEEQVTPQLTLAPQQPTDVVAVVPRPARTLFYERVSPYQLREELLKAKEILDENVKSMAFRVEIEGGISQYLVSGLKLLLQVLKDLARRAGGYTVRLNVWLKASTKTTSVTVNATTSDIEQVERLLNIARSFGEFKEIRVEAEYESIGGEYVKLRDVAEEFNRRMLAKYPNLLMDVMITLEQG